MSRVKSGVMFIGDVHGNYDHYARIVQQSTVPTVQLGDFGFRYDILGALQREGADPARHRVLGGNHDNYDILFDRPQALAHHGTLELGGLEAFYVRGELSVDKQYRVEGRSWWRAEELDAVQSREAILSYERHVRDGGIDLVFSHGCPGGVVEDFITNPSKRVLSHTAKLLQSMWEIARPKLWLFGHHHHDKEHRFGGTRFVCLNELSRAIVRRHGDTYSVKRV